MIALGNTLPDLSLIHATGGGGTPVTSHSLTQGKTLILFAVPGAFTPTCTEEHFPSFVRHAAALKSKRVDMIACLSVNDPFVMAAWGKERDADNQIVMLADHDAAFTRAIGMELDLSAAGLGIRSRRYAMLVRNGVVEVLNLDEGPKFEVSSAEKMLDAL